MSKWRAVNFIALLVVLQTAGALQAGLPTATEIKCLMMVDLDAFNFKGPEVAEKCRERMQATADVFRSNVQLIGQTTNVPVRINTLENVTKNGILDALNATEVTPTTTLIVYYHGHGATDGVRGHYFALTDGPPVFRSEILDASLFPARPMLLILISDCCSSRSDVPLPVAAPFNPDLARILTNLFLQHRGVVDVTGATYYPEHQEGQVGILGDLAFFTQAFGETIGMIPHRNLDKDADGFVSWTEFFPEVQEATDKKYAALVANGNGHMNQLHQRPQAFCLGRRSDLDSVTPHYRLGVDVAPNSNGDLVVQGVKQGSPAANIIELNGKKQTGNSHFIKGDIIRRLNGQRVRSIQEIHLVLSGVPKRESLRIEGIDTVHENSPYSALVRLDQ